MQLKDIVHDLKVGDEFYIKVKVEGLGEQDKKLEDRHFDLSEKVLSSMIGAPVYGNAEVVLERPLEATNYMPSSRGEMLSKHTQGMVEAYEKILIGRQVTIGK